MWTGVVPLYGVLGEPVSSGVTGEQGESEDAMGQIEEWRTEFNEKLKKYSEAAAVVGKDEKDMREVVDRIGSEARAT